MPYKPLVSKIRVHNPNKKGSANANRNYVKYIATREGVSLETVNDINDVLNTDGMMEKVLREDVIHTEANNKEYLEYMARRPRSHGLFGNIDTEDLTEVSSRIDGLTKEGKVIYRGIISLGERDGEELGFRNAGAWNNYLKRVMPEIAQKLGISSYDHTWVAAFHAEESHPHVHYMLWDNQDRVKSPFIHKATQQSIRICLEEEMFDDAYERSVKLVYDEELKELNSIRNERRKQILNETENVMRETFAPGVEYEKIPQRAANEYLESIAQEAQELTLMLPGKGSMKYQYLPEDAKEQVQKIVDLVLQKPDIRDSMEKYMDGVEKTQQLKGWTRTRIQAVLEKEHQDIRKRIANKVLKEIRPVVLANEPQEKQEEKKQEKKIEAVIETSDDTAEAEYFNYSLQWNANYKAAKELLRGEDMDAEQAAAILEREAISGNALAVFEVAKIFDREMVQGADRDEADEYYAEARRAFETIYNFTNNEYEKQYAAHQLGMIYSSGLGIEADKDEGEKYLLKASEMGNKAAAMKVADMYLEKEDEPLREKAIDILENLADQNETAAQYKLGKVYSDEKNKEKEIYDLKKAVSYLEKSAGQGNQKQYAQYKLGTIYANKENAEAGYYDLEKAVSYLEQSEKKGNQYAQYKLGTIYANKENEEAGYYDLEKAVSYLEQSEKKGNQYAQYKLGTIYANKENEEAGYYDLEKAVVYLEKSEKQNNQYAQYRLGVIYANAENEETGYYDLQKAVTYLEQSADQGNGYAQYKLGVIYADAENEEAGYYDLQKAVTYLEESADQGNEYAQYKLGVIYANKENQEAGYYDLQKAVSYLEKSENRNNEYAQYKLGAIFANKENAAAGYYNLEKAVSYLEKSADQKNPFAQYKLGVIYANAENAAAGRYDLEKAVSYLEESENQNNQYAQYKLGTIYANRENAVAGYYNLEKAVSYLEKAEEQGNEYAQYKLGMIYLDRDNIGQGYYNIEKSVEYLKKAAAQNNEYAQYRLGMMYLDKSFGRYDLREALRYLNLSAEQNNQFAQCRLGCMYYFGKEVSRDKELGAYWLQRSADQGNQFAQDILNGGCIGINFSYCLLKGILTSLESMNRQMDYTNYENMRTQSRQAARERHLHQDQESPGE